MNILDVKSVPERDRGWAVVKIDLFDISLNGHCFLVIERKMHSKSFLSRDGWQVSESRIKLESQVNSDGFTFVYFDPELTHFLDVGNYTFHLFNLDSVSFGDSIVRWKGIPRVPKKSIKNIIPNNNDFEFDNSIVSDNSNRNNDFFESSYESFHRVQPLNSDAVFSKDDLTNPDSGQNDISADNNNNENKVDSDSTDDSIVNLSGSNPDEYPVFNKVQVFICYQCKNKIFYGLKSCLFCGANY